MYVCVPLQGELQRRRRRKKKISLSKHLSSNFFKRPFFFRRKSFIVSQAERFFSVLHEVTLQIVITATNSSLQKLLFSSCLRRILH